MKQIIPLILLSFLSHVSLADEPSTPAQTLKAGSFVGFIWFDGSSSRIPTVLELIPGSGGEKATTIAGHMRIEFGGFGSHEYLAQFYDFQKFDWKTLNPRLNLSAMLPGNGQDISVIGLRINPDSGHVVGKVLSTKAPDRIGHIEVMAVDQSNSSPQQVSQTTATAKIKPNLPIIPAITGQYFLQSHNLNKISGSVHMIQFEAVKRYSWERSTSNPMEGYLIRGRTGQVPKRTTMGTAALYDLTIGSPFSDGNYDFYREIITVHSLGMECKVLSAGIQCGERLYVKDRNSSISEKLFNESAPESPHKSRLNLVSPGIREINNESLAEISEYTGYIFVEGRNEYQVLSLELIQDSPASQEENTNENGIKPMPSYSGSARYYMDGGGIVSTDFAPIKVHNFSWDGVSSAITVIGNNGRIIQITSWNEDGISGIWYSRSFGRVGAFELLRGGHEALKKYRPHVQIHSLEGKFFVVDKFRPGFKKHLMLDVSPDFKGNMAATVFPFEIGGFYRLTKQGLNNPVIYDSISSGLYDPFTGVLHLSFDSGRIMIGRFHNGALEVFVSTENEYDSGFEYHVVTSFNPVP